MFVLTVSPARASRGAPRLRPEGRCVTGRPSGRSCPLAPVPSPVGGVGAGVLFACPLVWRLTRGTIGDADMGVNPVLTCHVSVKVDNGIDNLCGETPPFSPRDTSGEYPSTQDVPCPSPVWRISHALVLRLYV